MDSWRRKIDQLDAEIRDLLNRRAKCALEIGIWKAENGLPVYDPLREKEILTRVVADNQGPLSGDALRRLFERILDESRGLERGAVTKTLSNPRMKGR